MIKSHYSCHITADKLVSTFFKQVLFHEDGSVKGIATNDVGIGKDGSPKVCHHHKIVHVNIPSRAEYTNTLNTQNKTHLLCDFLKQSIECSHQG